MKDHSTVCELAAEKQCICRCNGKLHGIKIHRKLDNFMQGDN